MDCTFFIHETGALVRRLGPITLGDRGEVLRRARLEFIRVETTAIDVWEGTGELYRIRRNDLGAALLAPNRYR